MIFYSLNHFCNTGFVPYALNILSNFFMIWCFAVYYILFCIYQIYRLNKLSPSIRDIEYEKVFYTLVQVGTCYAFFGFAYAMLKFSINLPRPYCSLPEGSFVTIMNMEGVRCLSSFPSAHVGLAFMMAIFLWPHIGKLYRCLAVITVVLVALARITLAMHYPADIMYSLVITVLAVAMSQLIFSIFSDNIIKYLCQKIKGYVLK